MDNSYKTVFKDQIWDFFVNDIEACFRSAKVAQDGDRKGGQNFTAALVILTVIYFCAGFYVGKTQASSSEVSEFITKYLGRFDDAFKNERLSMSFIDVFRHGLSHQWSPKSSGVAMDFNGSDVLFLHNDVLVLNVPPFFGLVKKALKAYEDDLGIDNELNKNFTNAYKKICEKDKKEAAKLINLLKK